MKVSYEENLANYFGLQRRGGPRSVLSVRAKGNAGQPLSFDITTFVCRSCPERKKATPSLPFMARHRRARRSLRPFGVFLWCLSDIVQIIRTQRCVVESAAQIRVAVFVKPSIAVLQSLRTLSRRRRTVPCGPSRRSHEPARNCPTSAQSANSSSRQLACSCPDRRLPQGHFCFRRSDSSGVEQRRRSGIHVAWIFFRQTLIGTEFRANQPRERLSRDTRQVAMIDADTLQESRRF